MTRKISFSTILILLAALALIAATFLFTPTGQGAEAAEPWQPHVMVLQGSTYTQLSRTDTVKVDGDASGEGGTSKSLTFLVYPGAEEDDNWAFSYFVSTTLVTQETLLNESRWNSISSDDKINSKDGNIEISDGDEDEVREYYRAEVSLGIGTSYIYFRRLRAAEGGNSEVQIYSDASGRPIRWTITVEENINIEFDTDPVTATYIRGGTATRYVGGWISGGLTFNVNLISDSPAIRLHYSIDGRSTTDRDKEWRPMTGRSVTINDEVDRKTIYFRSSDASGNVRYASYGTVVQIDPNQPVFGVSAVTTDGSGASVNYENRAWSRNDVRFTLRDESECVSGITYYVSTDNGGSYVQMTPNSLGAVVHTCSTTVSSGLRFRATTEAGVSYDYVTTYYVNIDRVQPGLGVDARHNNPAEGGEGYVDLDVTPGATTDYDAGFANDRIMIRLSNRDSEGIWLNNASGIKYYYASTSSFDAAGNPIDFGAYREVTGQDVTDAGTYFYFTESITSGIAMFRAYKVYGESGAGIRSDEYTIYARILSSDFELSIGDIIYDSQNGGWTSKPIDITVKMPADTHRDNSEQGFTEPTLMYNFVYSPTNMPGVVYESGYVPGLPGRVAGENVGFIVAEEGMWNYSFQLSASAESSFQIFAVNQAGKRSKNVHLTPEVIKIDTIPPQYDLRGYIESPDEAGVVGREVADGEWVSGRVRLLLRVRLGISGIRVRELRYAVDGLGVPVYDNTGNLVWQEGNEMLSVRSEQDPDTGETWFVFAKSGLGPSGEETYLSEIYGFRVYTLSGIYVDVTFKVNVDSNPINLERVALDATTADGNTQEMAAGEGAGEINFKPISTDGTLTFIANGSYMGDIKSNYAKAPDHELHFGIFYKIGDAGDYIFVKGNTVPINIIDSGISGDLIIHVRLVSDAGDFNSLEYREGQVGTAGYDYETGRAVTEEFTLTIPFNRKNESIGVNLVTTAGEDGNWVNQETVEVRLSIASDRGEPDNPEFGVTDMDTKYKFYYYPVEAGTTVDPNKVPEESWILLKPVANSVDGSYYFNDSRGYWMAFDIDFAGRAFNGQLMFSAVNEAGYRTISPETNARKIMVDNTTPDIDEFIVGALSYEDDPNQYYSVNTITLRPPVDRNAGYGSRAPIHWYVYEVKGADKPGSNPVLNGDNNGWTLLGDGDSIELKGDDAGKERVEYEYLIFAVNDVGATAGGYETSIKFTIDNSEMTGSLTYNAQDGYFDGALNMFTFMWKDSATLYLSVQDTNTQVYFAYRVIEEGGSVNYNWVPFYADLTQTHIDWREPGDDGAVSFSATINWATNGTYYFRAVNRAGKVFDFPTPIYIAIDNAAPVLEVKVTENGADYNADTDGSLDESGISWSSVPLTFELTLTSDNPGGVLITYTVQYRVPNQTELYTTSEREVPAMTFTTDRLDGFGKNRDAIITFYIVSRANGQSATIRKHVRVDQVVPVFVMTGHGTDESVSSDVILTSGQWTNCSQVRVSIATDSGHPNVSGVTYRVEQINAADDSRQVTEGWAIANMVNCYQSSTVRVTATSEAGLTYTEDFLVRIDTVVPIITFEHQDELGIHEGANHYIDLRVKVQEENIEICEYICTKGETRGFAFDPNGYILSTSSVNNSTQIDPSTLEEYRGYVKVYVKDFAGNEASFELYILPFGLDVNNVTLSDEDLAQVASYADQLNKARDYMEQSRVVYFENLISRLNDRINTLQNEINTYRAYLERLAQRTSFELNSDYWEMYDYLETYNNYEAIGQKWLQDAIRGDRSSVYYVYFEYLQSAFGQLSSQMDKVFDVEEKTTRLPAINVVVATDYDDVIRVYDEYMDLSADQKSCFTSNLYNKLFDLKKKCEVLMLADDETGVSMEADFAPGAKIRVEQISSDMESYRNAQTSILNSFDDTVARAVVSIYRVSLTGAASQTATGDVILNLPIPEDYRQYVVFSVYKMRTDGSLARIDDVYIEGDGRSVTFTSDELSTFVLCARANIRQNTVNTNNFGSFMGLELDAQLIRTIAIIGAALFAVVFVVIIIVALRHRRFLNTYNRAYKSGIYRKGLQQIPKGNTMPRENPFKERERVRENRKAY